MASILNDPPGYVMDHLATLTDALDQLPADGGVPAKDGVSLLLATWNIREFGRYTPKWRSLSTDTPKRDLRSVLFIATILERFDVIALQELQASTIALQEVLRWLNRDHPARWRVVVTDVVHGDAGDSERLGYLFDSSRFDLDGLVGEIVIPPEEIGHVTEERLGRQFAKTPYAISLRSVQSTDMAFMLITVHLVWGSDPALRAAEANRLARWIADWASSPHVWNPDIFALGDFNADRVTNPDGSVNAIYAPFAELLTLPEKMNDFPRTIFAAGQNKHYDMVTWHDPNNTFGLTYDDCGYFDIDTVLRPNYKLTAGSFSFRISDHYPMWARFT